MRSMRNACAGQASVSAFKEAYDADPHNPSQMAGPAGHGDRDDAGARRRHLDHQHATSGGFEMAPTTAGADGDFAVTSIPPIVPATPLPSPFQFRTTVYKEDSASSDALIYAHVLCA